MNEHGDEEIEKYIERIQPDIAYCDTCQPYDGGEVVWIHGVCTDLEDLFYEYEVPDDLRDELADKLQCQGCGRQL